MTLGIKLIFKIFLHFKVLDSYIKAKLDESLAKELNIKLQHVRKQIDKVMQEKERLEKAHKNTIIKIQVGGLQLLHVYHLVTLS